MSFYLSQDAHLLAAMYAGDRMYRRESDMEKLTNQMKKVSEKRTDVLLCQAYHAKLHKRLHLAAGYAHKVIAREPKNEDALMLLGALSADQKQMKEAVSSFKQAIAAAPRRYGLGCERRNTAGPRIPPDIYRKSL